MDKEKYNSNSIQSQSLDFSEANNEAWIVKVPNYLAKKWNDAPKNSEVGVIRLTNSKDISENHKMVLHLNESLGQCVSFKKEDITIEEKIPLDYKFVIKPINFKAVYILKQSEELAKESLSIVGKVEKRAECIPFQNDLNYIKLKQKTKKFSEPKRKVQLCDTLLPKQVFLPKDNKKIQKRKDKNLREDKEKVLDVLFNAFKKHQYYRFKDLVKIAKQPQKYLKYILNEICIYNDKGSHKRTWELKNEYKVNGQISEKKKKKTISNDFIETDDEEEFIEL